jgi:hypothetical protein
MSRLVLATLSMEAVQDRRHFHIGVDCSPSFF